MFIFFNVFTDFNPDIVILKSVAYKTPHVSITPLSLPEVYQGAVVAWESHFTITETLTGASVRDPGS